MVDATYMSPAANGLANHWQTTQMSQLPSVRTAAYTQSTAAQQRDLENYAREQRRQADQAYGLKKKEIDQQYQTAKLNARTAQERNAIDKWYNEQQVKIAQERLVEEGRQFDQRLSFDRESFGQRLGFDREVHADTLGLNRAKLGYDVLGLQAQYGRGAENYFQASELARNVAAQPGTATFLDALRNNTNLAGYGAQAGAPVRADINNLSAKLGGPQIMPGTSSGASGSLSNDDANLSAIRNIGLAGAHKLGAGSLEQLTDTELKLLQSGLEANGFDLPTFMQQHRRSRVSQGLGNSRAA